MDLIIVTANLQTLSTDDLAALMTQTLAAFEAATDSRDEQMMTRQAVAIDREFRRRRNGFNA